MIVLKRARSKLINILHILNINVDTLFKRDCYKAHCLNATVTMDTSRGFVFPRLIRQLRLGSIVIPGLRNLTQEGELRHPLTKSILY